MDDAAVRSSGPTRHTGFRTQVRDKPWVSQSLTDTMPATQVGAVGAAQLAFIPAVVVSHITVPVGLPIGTHLLLATVAAVTVWHRMTPIPFMVMLYASLAMDFMIARSVDGALVTIAFATAALSSVMPVMLFRGRWPVVAAALVTPAIAAPLLLTRPDADPTVVVALATTDATLLVAAVLLMGGIRRLSDTTDRAEAASADERSRAALTEAAVAAAVENARTLHDTVVNTLDALAHSAAVHVDPAVIRDRCAQDLARAAAWMSTEDRREEHFASFWHRVTRRSSIEVRRSGLTDDEWRTYEALLDPPVARALQGCITELIQNASKHSGAHHIEVSAQVRDGVLVVVIRDDGIGFDGHPIPGGGLADSVFARARAHRVRVDLHSARGRGTRAVLQCALDGVDATAAAPLAPAPNVGTVVGEMHRRMCWRWAAVIVSAGFVTEAINRHARWTDADLMLALVGMLSAMAWWSCRRGRTLPGWLTGLIVIGAPAACTLAFRAVDFGENHAFLLQTAALTPLFVILTVLAASRWPLRLAVCLIPVAVALPAAIRPGAGVHSLAMVAIMAAPLAALLWALYLFYRGVDAFGRRRAQAWSETQHARLASVRSQAAGAARTRWNAVGLDASVQLLRGIATGRLDPNDPGVRERCGREGRYLREIIALTPGKGPLGWWLALALADARAHGVALRLRTGATERVDHRVADTFGRIITDSVAAAPGGSNLMVSVFDYRGSPRLFVVGPLGTVTDQVHVSDRRCRLAVRTAGRQVFLEAHWVDDGTAERDSDPGAIVSRAGSRAHRRPMRYRSAALPP